MPSSPPTASNNFDFAGIINAGANLVSKFYPSAAPPALNPAPKPTVVQTTAGGLPKNTLVIGGVVLGVLVVGGFFAVIASKK